MSLATRDIRYDQLIYGGGAALNQISRAIIANVPSTGFACAMREMSRRVVPARLPFAIVIGDLRTGSKAAVLFDQS